ncbi:MAG: M23 family metallopeptidase [Epsilonproteobacteria bacterium]|nr:M23 family metallopeptidase [Campylobacterota bacterium]
MKKILGFLFIFLIIALPAYLYKSQMFERVPPTVEFHHGPFWNLKDKFEIKIKDNSGIKFYKIVLINDNKAKILKKEQFTSNPPKEISYSVTIPKFYPIKGDKITLKVEAVDNSKWNYFAGNEIIRQQDYTIDTTYPIAEVINNNYAMKRGGSGIAIIKIKDNNLDKAYIQITNRENQHKTLLQLTPFYKKDYYISLLAWPYDYHTFSADVVAIDKAKNKTIAHIPIRWKKAKYPHVKIHITDRFIQQIAIPLLERLSYKVPHNPIQIFKMVNETERAVDEKKIYKLTHAILDKRIDNFYISPFMPMRGYAKKASFGEVRSYYYNNQIISKAIHKGLDMASYRHANIYASNKAQVLFGGFVGIYGNTLMLYHKIGLVSTYSHCSMFNVQKGMYIKRGSMIAKTGSSGAVFGDHLHFGVYIQGIPVEPLEWMDGHWIRDNITSVIIKAKRIINSK